MYRHIGFILKHLRASLHYHRLKAEIDKTLHARGIHAHATYIYNNPTFKWMEYKLDLDTNKINTKKL